MESGAQYVMTLGMTLMLEWFALSWDTLDKVCYMIYCIHGNFYQEKIFLSSFTVNNCIGEKFL